MGSSESKQSSTETEKLNSSHQTTETDEDRTPIANRRVIQLTDPRSPPPDDVSRTPIVHAEKAAESAEPTSPVLKINTRITQEVTDMHDPRSPSCNVARTPQPFKFGDPRSPSQAVSRTPHIAHIEEQGDPRSPTPGVERSSFTPEEAGAEARRSSFECLVDESNPEQPAEDETPNTSEHSNDGATHDDIVTEIESEEDSLKTQLIAPSTAEAEPTLKQINTPQYEAELSSMVTKNTIYCDAEEDGDDAPCLTTDSVSEHKTKSRKKSLKDKVQQKFQGGAPRSPLSTRNLLSDSPSLRMHSDKGSVSYMEKRRRHTVGVTPTRLVGRYEPMADNIDKENA